MEMVGVEILSIMPPRISTLNHGTIRNRLGLRMVTMATITTMPSHHPDGSHLHLALVVLRVAPLHLFRTHTEPTVEDSLKALLGINNLLTTDPNPDMDRLPEDRMIVEVAVIPIEDITEDVRRVPIIAIMHQMGLVYYMALAMTLPLRNWLLYYIVTAV